MYSPMTLKKLDSFSKAKDSTIRGIKEKKIGIEQISFKTCFRNFDDEASIEGFYTESKRNHAQLGLIKAILERPEFCAQAFADIDSLTPVIAKTLDNVTSIVHTYPWDTLTESNLYFKQDIEDALTEAFVPLLNSGPSKDARHFFCLLLLVMVNEFYKADLLPEFASMHFLVKFDKYVKPTRPDTIEKLKANYKQEEITDQVLKAISNAGFVTALYDFVEASKNDTIAKTPASLTSREVRVRKHALFQRVADTLKNLQQISLTIREIDSKVPRMLALVFYNKHKSLMFKATSETGKIVAENFKSLPLSVVAKLDELSDNIDLYKLALTLTKAKLLDLITSMLGYEDRIYNFIESDLQLMDKIVNNRLTQTVTLETALNTIQVETVRDKFLLKPWMTIIKRNTAFFCKSKLFEGLYQGLKADGSDTGGATIPAKLIEEYEEAGKTLADLVNDITGAATGYTDSVIVTDRAELQNNSLPELTDFIATLDLRFTKYIKEKVRLFACTNPIRRPIIMVRDNISNDLIEKLCHLLKVNCYIDLRASNELMTFLDVKDAKAIDDISELSFHIPNVTAISTQTLEDFYDSYEGSLQDELFTTDMLVALIGHDKASSESKKLMIKRPSAAAFRMSPTTAIDFNSFSVKLPKRAVVELEINTRPYGGKFSTKFKSSEVFGPLDSDIKTYMLERGRYDNIIAKLARADLIESAIVMAVGLATVNNHFDDASELGSLIFNNTTEQKDGSYAFNALNSTTFVVDFNEIQACVQELDDELLAQSALEYLLKRDDSTAKKWSLTCSPTSGFEGFDFDKGNSEHVKLLNDDFTIRPDYKMSEWEVFSSIIDSFISKRALLTKWTILQFHRPLLATIMSEQSVSTMVSSLIRERALTPDTIKIMNRRHFDKSGFEKLLFEVDLAITGLLLTKAIISQGADFLSSGDGKECFEAGYDSSYALRTLLTDSNQFFDNMYKYFDATIETFFNEKLPLVELYQEIEPNLGFEDMLISLANNFNANIESVSDLRLPRLNKRLRAIDRLLENQQTLTGGAE